jgi:hypothetical protein
MGYAVLRGFMLAVLTVLWLARKMRHPDATESERPLLWMVSSRTILLGVVILLLSVGGRREALAWVLLGDGALQLFDTLLALALHKRKLAVLPALLCLFGGWAGIALMS